jgi:NAD(P)-dependent dehydrogenase (short-subunit alcohol dehydrogenase family)
VNLSIAGHTAVIVGGARGIGRAIAEGFAAEGAQLCLVDRDAEVAGAAQQIAERFGVRVVAQRSDVTSNDAMREAAGEVLAAFGRVDHIVYAVAIGSGKYGFPFWNLEPGDWGRVLEVNVIGAVHVAHAFAPALVKARAGTMLFLASVAGQIGSQTDPPYSASKAALINFAQCAAKDLAPYGVRVNTLCPGMVQTALNRSVWEAWNRLQAPENRQPYEDWAQDKIRRLVPLGRWRSRRTWLPWRCSSPRRSPRTSPGKPSTWTAASSCTGDRREKFRIPALRSPALRIYCHVPAGLSRRSRDRRRDSSPPPSLLPRDGGGLIFCSENASFFRGAREIPASPEPSRKRRLFFPAFFADTLADSSLRRNQWAVPLPPGRHSPMTAGGYCFQTSPRGSEPLSVLGTLTQSRSPGVELEEYRRTS